MKMKLPEDKFMSTVKVGEKGQIVIPKEARDMFEIEPGDSLMLLADKDRGIAIVAFDGMVDFMEKMIDGAKGAEGDEKK